MTQNVQSFNDLFGTPHYCLLHCAISQETATSRLSYDKNCEVTFPREFTHHRLKTSTLKKLVNIILKDCLDSRTVSPIWLQENEKGKKRGRISTILEMTVYVRKQNSIEE